MSVSCIGPITSAKLSVLPIEHREAEFAAALIEGPPDDAFESLRILSKDDLATARLVVGLRAKLAGSLKYRLAGYLAIFERPISVAHGSDSPPRFLIMDGLAISSALLGWNPSLRSVLLSYSAVLLATVEHDDRCKGPTYVACRIARHDGLAKQALEELGAIRMEPSPILTLRRRPQLRAADDSELHFFDDAALRLAAARIGLILNRDDKPRRAYRLERDGDEAREAQLAITFSTGFRHLGPEIELLASGEVKAGWELPNVAEYDRVRYMRG